MDVVLEVAAEAVDPLAQHGDLDLSGTRVGAVGLVGVDQLLLLGGIKRHARGAALSVQTTTLPGQGPSLRHQLDTGPQPGVVVSTRWASPVIEPFESGVDFFGFVAEGLQCGEQLLRSGMDL